MICRIVQRLCLGVRYSTEREQGTKERIPKGIINSRVILFLQVKKSREGPGDEATRE